MTSPRRPLRAMGGPLAGCLGVGLVMLPSCDPIVAKPLSSAPTNVCSAHPCDLYEPGARVRARCGTEDRCEIPGRLEVPYWIVVHVPETSYFAPGTTFVLSSEALTKTPDPSNRSRCTPPQCLVLPSLRQIRGTYSVSREASTYLGYALDDGAYKVRPDTGERYLDIPVRARLESVGPDDAETYPRLPLSPMFAASAMYERGSAMIMQYTRFLPPGRYARVLYPEPPFDAYFPPAYSPGEVITADEFADDFRLGTKHPLDDVACDEHGCIGGDARVAIVKRAEGLAGWRAWLSDRRSARRLSTVRPLSGTEATVRLDTSGEGDGLGDDVEAVVAPPEGWTAVPRLVTPLFGGQGLKNLAYPSIPPPVSVSGVVAEPGGAEGGRVLGYAAGVAFESDALATSSGEPTTLLRYATSVSTDDKGRFSTVLPPGAYRAIIEPAEGTAFAKTSQMVVVERGPTAFTLRPPPRALVHGRAVLTDERALGEATVLAIPDEPVDGVTPRPRPGRTETDLDGGFAMELDPGSYVVSVIPKAGTGFPRVAVRTGVPVGSTEAPDLRLPDVRVPAPTRVSFTLRDPSQSGNPIVRAVVRVLASPAGGGPPVEIGSAMTNPDGLVEILLAQEAR